MPVLWQIEVKLLIHYSGGKTNKKRLEMYLRWSLYKSTNVSWGLIWLEYWQKMLEIIRIWNKWFQEKVGDTIYLRKPCFAGINSPAFKKA